MKSTYLDINPHKPTKIPTYTNPHTYIVISPYNAPLTQGEEYIDNLNEVLEIASQQVSEVFAEYNPHTY